MLVDRPSRAAGDHTKLTPNNAAMAPTPARPSSCWTSATRGTTLNLAASSQDRHARPLRLSRRTLLNNLPSRTQAGKGNLRSLAMSLPGKLRRHCADHAASLDAIRRPPRHAKARNPGQRSSPRYAHRCSALAFDGKSGTRRSDQRAALRKPNACASLCSTGATASIKRAPASSTERPAVSTTALARA